MASRQRALSLTKGLEEKRQELLRNSNARILHHQLHLLASSGGRCADPDPAAVGKFNGVEDYVAQDLFHFDFVRLQQRQRLAGFPDEVDLLAAEADAKEQFQFFPNILKTKLLHADHDLARFDPRSEEHTSELQSQF